MLSRHLVKVNPLVRAALLAVFCLSVHCGKAASPLLQIPAADAAEMLDSLVVLPADPRGERGREIDPEIRREAKKLPGQLHAASHAEKCTEEHLAYDDDLQSESASGETLGGSPVALGRLLACWREEGASAVLVPRFRSLSARFNMGTAFFCGASRSIRPVAENPFAPVRQTGSQGRVGAICLDVALFTLEGERVYHAEFPFATTSRLDSGRTLGFVRVPFSEAAGDPDNRAAALEATLMPLLDALR